MNSIRVRCGPSRTGIEKLSAAEAVERNQSKRQQPGEATGRVLTNPFNFDQFSALAGAYHTGLTALPAWEDTMENFAELIKRLLEIQSGGRRGSPGLIGEDERLTDDPLKRYMAGKPTHRAELSQDSSDPA